MATKKPSAAQKKAQDNARRAMALAKSKGVTLKAAWAQLKSGASASKPAAKKSPSKKKASSTSKAATKKPAKKRRKKSAGSTWLAQPIG